jgi:hypothetical protein
MSRALGAGKIPLSKLGVVDKGANTMKPICEEEDCKGDENNKCTEARNSENSFFFLLCLLY